MFYWNKLALQCCVCYMCTESCSVIAIPILTHVCLFLAVLGPHRRRLSLVAGSGCDPSQLRLTGSSCCGAQALGPRASAQFWHTGLAALRHMEPSRTRDQTRVPHVGSRIRTHCTTMEVQGFLTKARRWWSGLWVAQLKSGSILTWGFLH